MALAGWEIEYVDMDITGQRPIAEIKVQRDDGRWLWARADAIGRCTTETYQREHSIGMAANQRGLRPLVPLVEDVFLGRRRHEGPRSMLRNMTNYLADNALHPVALADLRDAWAGVMSAPVRTMELVKIDGKWYAPSAALTVVEPTREDIAAQVAIDAKREAVAKAKAAGLTDADLLALGLSG